MVDLGKKYNKKRGKHSYSSGTLALKLILMAAVSSILGLGAFYACRFYQESRNEGFLLGTTVQGENVYGMTPDEVASVLAQNYGDSEITLTEGDEVDLKGTLADYGYTFDEESAEEALQKVLNEQKSDRGAVLQSVLGGYQYALTIGLDFDESVFDSMVSIDNLAVERFPSEDAKVVYDESAGTCVIQKEVQGNEIDEDDLRGYVKDEIDRILADVEENGFSGNGAVSQSSADGVAEESAAKGRTGAEDSVAADTDGASAVAGKGLSRSIEFPWSLCEAPSILSDDEVLQQEAEALNEYSGAQVTYDFGDETEVLSFDEIIQLMTFEDGEAVPDDEKIADYVEKLADKYDTRYKERTFKTTLAGTITIGAGSNEYGYTIDQEDEAAQLKEDIESGTAVEREPVYYTENSYGNPYYLRRNGTDDLDGTYVEVDLTAQHMWFYKDGELVIDSDVVSGDVTKGHGTQTGVFPLAYKESPSVLTGGNGNGAYETPVQYWMPFYEGQGLHDADWRAYFGGSIYRGNGSHGCVNLPPSVAATVYNNIETGTAIVIYYE